MYKRQDWYRVNPHRLHLGIIGLELGNEVRPSDVQNIQQSLDMLSLIHISSGMTSQAYGRHDLNEITRLLLRAVGVGLFIAFTLLALQYPIERIAFTFIQKTEEVEHLEMCIRDRYMACLSKKECHSMRCRRVL